MCKVLCIKTWSAHRSRAKQVGAFSGFHKVDLEGGERLWRDPCVTEGANKRKALCKNWTNPGQSSIPSLASIQRKSNK